MDADINSQMEIQASKRHPRIEDWTATMKILLKSKIAMSGLIISAFYFIVAILDWTYPQFLGVSAGNPLTNAILAFNRSAGVFWHGIPYTVGINANIPPYGSQAAITLVPPTLNGPSGTPGWWWWFGGTEYNLPLFPLMLAALKWDMTYTLIIVISGALIGTTIGTISGYYGGIIDEFVMRVTDIFFSIPFLVLAIALIYVFGAYLVYVVISLIIIWWPTYARLTRGQALSIKSNKFVEAASASGSSNMRTVFVHILPNVLAPVFVQISLDLGVVVQVFATLTFVGFHFTSPFLPELGNILTWGDSAAYIFNAPMNWWPIIIPGAFLVLFTVSVNLFGDGLRDVLDPKLRR